MSQPLPPCPLKVAHKRLLDCHVHWHGLANDYMDPESFRLKLNALIQELRNVTFVLQKQKATLRGFSVWYSEWQASAKADPVMTWLVNARNRIVKEADLGLLSVARARYTVDWDEEYERVFRVETRYTTRQIMNTVLRQIGGTEGLVTVERMWIDCKLPSHEILDATAHGLETLRKLILRAHTEHGVGACDVLGRERERECVEGDVTGLRTSFGCLEAGKSKRVLELSLDDFSTYTMREYVVRRDEAGSAEARSRYGPPPAIPSGDAIEAVAGFSDMARNVLACDGFHMFSVFFYKGEKIVHQMGGAMFDRNGTYAYMNRIADTAIRHRADSMVMITEVWLAPDHKTDTFTGRAIRPSERQDRREALAVSAASADGRWRSFVSKFSRDHDGKILLEDAIESAPDEQPAPQFAPILRRWSEQHG